MITPLQLEDLIYHPNAEFAQQEFASLLEKKGLKAECVDAGVKYLRRLQNGHKANHITKDSKFLIDFKCECEGDCCDLEFASAGFKLSGGV